MTHPDKFDPNSWDPIADEFERDATLSGPIYLIIWLVAAAAYFFGDELGIGWLEVFLAAAVFFLSWLLARLAIMVARSRRP